MTPDELKAAAKAYVESLPDAHELNQWHRERAALIWMDGYIFRDNAEIQKQKPHTQQEKEK